MSGLMFFGMTEGGSGPGDCSGGFQNPPNTMSENPQQILDNPRKLSENRADSPDSGGGGYFTLSDSGTESPQEEEITKSATLYKIFRANNNNTRSKSSETKSSPFDRNSGSRSRSETPLRSNKREETPQRPSPPKADR